MSMSSDQHIVDVDIQKFFESNTGLNSCSSSQRTPDEAGC